MSRESLLGPLVFGLLLQLGAAPRAWGGETQELAVITDNLVINAFSFGLAATTDAEGGLKGFAFDGWYLEPGDTLLSIRKTGIHEAATMEELQAPGGLTVQDVVSVRADVFPADVGGRVTLQFETNIVTSDPRAVVLRLGKTAQGTWALYYEHQGREVQVSRLHIAAAIEGASIVGISRIILRDDNGAKLAELAVSDLPRAVLPGAGSATTPDPRSHDGAGPAPAAPGGATGDPAPAVPGGAAPAR